MLVDDVALCASENGVLDSAIFNYIWNLFYCAQDIGAVVCPLIDHYATRTARQVSGVSPFWNHCMDGAHLFCWPWVGWILPSIPSMFGRVGCITHVKYRNEYYPGMWCLNCTGTG